MPDLWVVPFQDKSLEAVIQRCSAKKMFLISKNSQENTCARVSFLIKSKFSCEENFAVSRFFCQIAKFNSREYQDFLPSTKFYSTNFLNFFDQPRNLFPPDSNFENLEILMNGVPIKYDNSLMKVKKSNKSRLNSLLQLWSLFMRNGLSISKITWPDPKGNKLFQVAGRLQRS